MVGVKHVGCMLSVMIQVIFSQGGSNVERSDR
jgi:hypothetical protein